MKGIWIPEELMSLDISWTKRILIAEISQLEMLDKGCVASNFHFATKLKLSKQAVSKALNEMERDGLIIIDNAQTKRNFGRKITINFSKSGINFSKSGIHQSGESKENKTENKTNNMLLFDELWKKYTLEFLKKNGRNGGSKSKAFSLFCSLIEKYRLSDIEALVDNEMSLKFGNRDLERVLTKASMDQFMEDSTHTQELSNKPIRTVL